MKGAEIQVIGLKEFRSVLREADKALGPELRKGLNEVGKIIVDDTHAQIPRGPGTDGGHLADSLRAQSTQTAGQVMLGRGKTVGRAGYIVFGGGPTSPRGDNSRPFVKGGRFLFPSMKRKQHAIVAKLEDVLERLRQRIDRG